MSYQRGSLKQLPGKNGRRWLLRYRSTRPDGKRVENVIVIGAVCDLPKAKDAWREVDNLGLLIRINDESTDTRIRFNTLAEHYINAEFGDGAIRPKSPNTTPIVEHYVRDYLIHRFGESIADEIKPLEIQKWLKSLNQDKGLAW